MGEEGAVLFFKGRGAAFSVTSNSWVSLRSKEISIQTFPDIGPCLITHHSSKNILDITQFVLKQRIKAKKTGSEDTVAWIFKAGKMDQNRRIAKPIIMAVRFSRPRAATKFKEAYVNAFEEYNNSYWDCGVCTVRNNSEATICYMCDTTRPSMRKKEQEDEFKIEVEASRSKPDIEIGYEGLNTKSTSNNVTQLKARDSLEHSSDKDNWNCNYCSFLNPGHTNVCSMCSKTKQIKQKGWTCNLCTFNNEITRDKCEICEAERQPTENSKNDIVKRQRVASTVSGRGSVNSIPESERKLQHAADFILSRHPDGLVCFKTLSTICSNLYQREEKYRSLYVHQKTVQKKIISFDGALDFLKVLGFKLDDTGEKFVCSLEDPEESLLDEALNILKNTIENLERPKGSELRKPSKNGYRNSSSSIDSRASSPVKASLKASLARSIRFSIPEEKLPHISRLDSELSDSFLDDDEKYRRSSRSSGYMRGSTPGNYTTIRVIKDLDEDRPDDIDEWFENDEEEEVQSLHNLVYWLTKEKDDVGIEVLLLVHRTISTSWNLLNVLIRRFREHLDQSEISERNKIRRNVMQFCIYWVNNYYEDFESQPDFGKLFIQFLEQTIQEDQCRKTASRVREHLIEKQKDIEDLPMISIEMPMSKSKKSQSITDKKDQSVIGFKEREVAEVLTLLDYETFQQIKHRELLNQAWTKKDREKKSPNLLKMITRYNVVCKWTQISILSARGLDQRQKTLSWFIKLLVYLTKIQNYNSSWAVNGALNSTPIYNLKHTWAGIKKNQKNDFDSHTELFKATGNYRLLRKKMEALRPPAIPQFGVLLKDLVFIDDGFLLMKNETGSQINFRKCTKLAERIREGFGKFQQQPFEFNRNDVVLELLRSTQEKVSAVKETYLLDLSDQVKACDAKEKSKRFWG